MRARLYKGPFNGQTVNHHGGPLRISGYKRPRRGSKKWIEQTRNLYYAHGADLRPIGMSDAIGERVDAVYTQVMMAGPNGNFPSVHPDGSYYFIYQP